MKYLFCLLACLAVCGCTDAPTSKVASGTAPNKVYVAISGIVQANYTTVLVFDSDEKLKKYMAEANPHLKIRSWVCEVE